MLFTPSTGAGQPEGHLAYIAGRYRDGAYSDLWTDVRRCARSTFTAYAPACSCGWRGTARPIDDIALIACHRDWERDHRAALPAPHPVETSSPVHRSVPCVDLKADRP